VEILEQRNQGSKGTKGGHRLEIQGRVIKDSRSQGLLGDTGAKVIKRRFKEFKVCGAGLKVIKESTRFIRRYWAKGR
jgi:hypothetical protein